MSDLPFRLGQELVDAAQGPLQFRVLLQAVVAVGFGVQDARAGPTPPHGPRWVSLGKILLAVLAMDVAVQAIVLGFGAMAQGLVIALVVALPLYLATRAGLVWLGRRLQRRAAGRAVGALRDRP